MTQTLDNDICTTEKSFFFFKIAIRFLFISILCLFVLSAFKRLQFVITIKEIKFKFILIPQMMKMPQVKVSYN